MHGQRPSAYVDSVGNIVVTWYDHKYGSYCGFTGDILARISTDNGNSWLPESRLTYTQSGSGSSCIIYDNKIYVVWMDYFPLGCECSKIMYSESEDWGLTWTYPEVISGPTETMELSPALIYTNDISAPIMHCIIRKYYAAARCDLYYFRNEGFTLVESKDVDILPHNLKIYAYPNPFNSSITIAFNNPQGGDLRIDIFALDGRKTKSFNIPEQKGGNIIWDGVDNEGKMLASGIYFARVESNNYAKTIKLVYLK
jgi:hypothetical protein